MTMRARLWIPGWSLIASFGLLAVCVLLWGSLRLYDVAGRSRSDFYGKLGELALQLAVVVIVGALVKVLIDWGLSQHARYREKLEAQRELIRRVRAMHVTVQNAKDLLTAHQSARTWGEQSRRLMELRPEVEEIAEDLKVSQKLFSRQAEIIAGVEGIVSYLATAGAEYIRSHDAVDSDCKLGKKLADTIRKEGMTWIQDFMDGGAAYRKGYEANLTRSKGAMRAEVYGASEA